jgi:lysophospholipase L1-like esterase
MTTSIRARITLLALGLTAGLLIGEVVLRAYASFQDGFGMTMTQFDPMAALIVPHGELGYRQRPNSVFRYNNGTFTTTNSMGYRGPVVAVPKPSGTFRIILLGESTTHGWGVTDNETIDAYMRSTLRARYLDRRIDVVNLAFDGYDSWQLVERLRTDGMRLEPDLIIVNAGINDVRNARFQNLADPDPRTVLWASVLQRLREEQARGGPTIWTRIKHHSYLARLAPITRQYWAAASGRHEQPTFTPNRQAADIFESNLRRIVDLTSDEDTPLILSTPPSALPFRYDPHATSDIGYWLVDAASTEHLREELARRMKRVVASGLGRGRTIAYVSHRLSADMFLDDAHLTPSGNREMALDFVAAIAPFIPAHSISQDAETLPTPDVPTPRHTPRHEWAPPWRLRVVESGVLPGGKIL